MNQPFVEQALWLTTSNTRHEYHERCQLGCERLCRGNTDFRACLSEENKVARTNNGTVINIADGQLRKGIILGKVFDGR